MTVDTKLPRDDEECRLLAVYEESSTKEHAAAVQFVYPRPDLSDGAYMKLLSDLQIIRKNCNEQMLAVRARHNKLLDQSEILPQPKPTS
jgi:hypothetical protein